MACGLLRSFHISLGAQEDTLLLFVRIPTTYICYMRVRQCIPHLHVLGFSDFSQQTVSHMQVEHATTDSSQPCSLCMYVSCRTNRCLKRSKQH
jgi:hypothetical protein